MSATYYPAMLHLEKRRVLFIGGGWETEIKVRGLLDAGAFVTLHSEHAHPGLEEFALEGRIVWHRRAFQAGDTLGFWVVMSHPVNKADNAAVYAEAEANGILCNCVDDPERCSFILPSVMRRGDLVIGVSTSGTAPALGVRIKQRLNGMFGTEYTAFLDLLREMRPSITAGFLDFEARKQLWYSIIDSNALEHMKTEQTPMTREIARAEIKTIIEARRSTCRTTPCASCVGKNCPVHNLEPVHDPAMTRATT